MYNLTKVTDATNFLDMTIALDQQAGGLIGAFTLFIIMLLLFIGGKKYQDDTKGVLVMVCMIGSVLAILGWASGFMAWHIMIYPIIGLFGSIMVFKFSN